MNTEYSIDIIVPVFREEQTFREFYNTVQNRVNSRWRMLVVCDSPEDPTLPLAYSISEKDPRVVPILNPKGGVAEAIRTGLKAARAEAVMTTAVDLLEDVKKIDEMLKLFYEGNYTIVAPSRYVKGGKRTAGKFINRCLAKAANLSLHYLTGLPIHDATNGSKIFRKSFIDSLNLETTDGWVIALEITVKAHAARQPMIEIPVAHFKRQSGESKFKLFRWLPGYLKWYWFAIKNNFFG